MRYMNQSDFIRTFKIMGKNSFDFFLGSGASVQAGIPTGGNLVWYFKQQIFCSNTNTSSEFMKDLQSKQVRIKLQNYFDSTLDNPPLWSPIEYAYYFEKCFPTSIAREKFIQDLVRDRKPSLGHLCLGHLMINGFVQSVWTTNFDSLVENGISMLSPTQSFKVHSSANQANATMTGDESFIKIYKLHGDYRYDKIKNTTQELQSLENLISDKFVRQINGKGIIVIGYSGSDESIMSELENNFESLKYGLIWMIQKGGEINERVRELMEKICQVNELSAIVEIDGFDEILYQCYQAVEISNELIDGQWKNFHKRKLPITFMAKHPDHFIKTNTFLAEEIPMCMSFQTDITSWKELRRVNVGNKIIAALYSGRIYCLENEEDINSVFKGHILSKIIEDSIPAKDLYRDNSIYIGMLYDLISDVLCRRKNIKPFDKLKFYLLNSRTEYMENYWKYDACEMYIHYENSKFYLSLLPTVYMEQKDGYKIEDTQKQTLINDIMSKLYNKQYNEKLYLWNNLLIVQNKEIIFEKKKFILRFSKVCLSSNGLDRKLSWPNIDSYQFEEPKMSFNVDKDDKKVTINQIKGLIAYAPIDVSFSKGIIRASIRISIIAPDQQVDKLISHLNRLKNKGTLKNSNDGFLQPYSGFESIYRRGLDIPDKDDKLRCLIYDEKKALAISRNAFVAMLKRGIDKIATNSLETDVLIIYIPNKFKRFREDIDGINDFNLHDAIKLYGTDKGVKIQFIEEKSINYYDNCKVMWGLSTSLYAKANGVLWHPAFFESDTAFVGISYAYSQKKGISIGCSQLFDCTGTGIRLIMRKIENPEFKGHNPYMKCDEARAVMSSLREQYYRSSPTQRLSRIVVHKTTPFTNEEIKGFTQALEGIDDIELLQIQELSPWRAIRFGERATDGAANFAIKRGTTIKVTDDSFLIWTHGTIQHEDLKGKMNYYKGGRGIPSPLLVRRYYGKASGETLVNEILMLTKMNWNSGDSLYKVLPVTLDFAKVLSRMSKQEEVIYNQAYDFRYFM